MGCNRNRCPEMQNFTDNLISFQLQYDVQGRCQDMERWGQEFFFRFANLHVAKPYICVLLGGFRGMLSRENRAVV